MRTSTGPGPRPRRPGDDTARRGHAERERAEAEPRQPLDDEQADAPDRRIAGHPTVRHARYASTPVPNRHVEARLIPTLPRADETRARPRSSSRVANLPEESAPAGFGFNARSCCLRPRFRGQSGLRQNRFRVGGPAENPDAGRFGARSWLRPADGTRPRRPPDPTGTETMEETRWRHRRSACSCPR